MMILKRLILIVAAIASNCCLSPINWAIETPSEFRVNTDLMEMDLESLLTVKVTSVSKKPENSFAAAAAVFVLTREDIRRSGATTIADALRLVPGLHVARSDSHTWAITSRGFNGELASKLLVLVDGRSVYTPLFAGVYWDIQDTILEDIDRIEVIRGPGGTLWGANAVNGVINIITQHSRETQGYYVTGGGGTEENGFSSWRYGGQIGEAAYFRVFGKYFNRDDSVFPNGADANDSWWNARGGFRIDWETREEDNFTLQGDLYKGRENQTRVEAIPSAPFIQVADSTDRLSGGNILGRWSHVFENGSDAQLQIYYDRTERESVLPSEKRDTGDIEFQHHFSLGEFQEIVWGSGYRMTSDRVEQSFTSQISPMGRTSHLASMFLQNEFKIADPSMRFTAGSKFEHNDFTGFEFQPTGRVSWTPSQKHTLWGAVSRAVRTPSRSEDDTRVNVPTSPPSAAVISILGDRGGVAEELLAYELGYRIIPHPRLSLDITTFYNDYDHLRSLEFGPPPSPPPLAAASLISANNFKGESYGIEGVANFEVMPHWRIQATYSFIRIMLHPDGTSDPSTEVIIEGNSPRHQFTVRSSFDVSEKVQLDMTFRYVDALRNPSIPSYLVMDLRLGWEIHKNWELTIVGQNLFDSQHPEFSPLIVPTLPTEVEQSVYAKITWRY